MKKHFFLILASSPMFLHLLMGTTVLLFLAFPKTGYELDTAVAFKPYQVSFTDWVFVYLSSEIGASEENYSVQVHPKLINKKVRFVVQGMYTDTAIGRDWYKNVGSKIGEAIASDCKVWTAQGHPISLNDFEITIRKISQQ